MDIEVQNRLRAKYKRRADFYLGFAKGGMIGVVMVVIVIAIWWMWRIL